MSEQRERAVLRRLAGGGGLILTALMLSANAAADMGTPAVSEDGWVAVGEPTLSAGQPGTVVLTVPLSSTAPVATQMAVTVSSDREIGASGSPTAKVVAIPAQACGPKCEPPPVQVAVPVGGASVPDAPGWVVVDLEITDETGQLDPVRHRIFLRETAGSLSQRTGADFVAAHNIGTQEEPVFAATGQRTPPPAALLHVHPLDNPAFSDSDKAHLAELLDKLPAPTSTATGALAKPDEPAGESVTATGCRSASGGAPAALLVLAAGLGLVLRRRRRAAALGLVAVIGAFPQPAHATSCYVMGKAALWDAVATHYMDYSGSRRDWCDTSDTNCRVTDADCCFEGLPRIKANLHRGSQSLNDIIQTTDSGDGGAFILWDTSCDYRADYYVSFTFERDGYPAKQRLTGESGSTPYTVVYDEALSLVANQWVNLGDVSLNAGGDTTSWAGDLASLWYASHMSFAAFEAEGVTRHRKTRGSASDYDLVTTRYYWWPDDGAGGWAICQSLVKIRLGSARDGTIAHQMGHILHYRTVGCSTERVGFVSPDKLAGGIPEGSWAEAFAGFAGSLLTFLDPTTTVQADLDGDPHTECKDIGHDYANDMSNRRNQVRGLWELIDTDTSGDNYEASMLSLEEIVDVMDAWQGTNTSCSERTANHTFCEVSAEQTQTVCESMSDCGAPVPEDGWTKDWKCLHQRCWKGDVHGRNIRDLIYHIAQDTGQSESLYENALTSSTCVGAADNTWRFTGGFRDD